MLDLLGIESSGVFDGKSQRAAIMGESDRGAHDLAFSETMFRKSWKTTVIDGTHQLIRDHHPQEAGEDGVQETLYALTDRDGVDDLSESMPEEHARLSQALTQWEAQMNELDATSPEAVTIELDGQMRAQLEAMGYLE
jgi:hypothetical protein